MKGGEIFVPKLPTVGIEDLAHVVLMPFLLSSRLPFVNSEIQVTGLRPGGEKLHECLLTDEEVGRTLYVPTEGLHKYVVNGKAGYKIDADFRYSSDLNPWWLDHDAISDLLRTEGYL